MKRIIAAMIVLGALALAASPALAQQTTGTVTGRIVDRRVRRARRDSHGAKPGHRVRANRRVGRGRHLPPDGAAGRHLRSHRGAAGLQQDREQGHRDQRRPDARPRLRDEDRVGLGNRRRDRRHAAHRDHQLLGRRRRRHQPHREPAAQRPAVRERGDDDPRRRGRLPLRSDEEHAGTRRRLAAATAAT